MSKYKDEHNIILDDLSEERIEIMGKKLKLQWVENCVVVWSEIDYPNGPFQEEVAVIGCER